MDLPKNLLGIKHFSLLEQNKSKLCFIDILIGWWCFSSFSTSVFLYTSGILLFMLFVFFFYLNIEWSFVLARYNTPSALIIKLCSETEYRNKPKMAIRTSSTPPRSPNRLRRLYTYLWWSILKGYKLMTCMKSTSGEFILIGNCICLYSPMS